MDNAVSSSGGSLSDKARRIGKTMTHGFDLYKSQELFPKKVRPTENEILEKRLEQVSELVQKERERRAGEETVEKEGTSEGTPKKEKSSPFADSPLDKAGTSEGAVRGWETRRAGGAEPKGEEEKPRLKIGVAGIKGWADTVHDDYSRANGAQEAIQHYQERLRENDPEDPMKPAQLKASIGKLEGKLEDALNAGADNAVDALNDVRAHPKADTKKIDGMVSQFQARLKQGFKIEDAAERTEELRSAFLLLDEIGSIDKAGTSEGAVRGWETRRAGGAAPESEEEKPLHQATEREREHEKMRIDTMDEAGLARRMSMITNPQKMKNFADALDESKKYPRMVRYARMLLRNMGYEKDGKPVKKQPPPEGLHVYAPGVRPREEKPGGREPLRRATDREWEHEKMRIGTMNDEELGRRLGKISDPQKLRNFADALEDENYHDVARLARLKLRSMGWDMDGKPISRTRPKIAKAIDDIIEKFQVNKILQEGGWDKLPLSDKAREVIEDAIHRGARPVTEYTGKVLVEHAIPEEPPAFTRPKRLNVGDTVVPLNWVGVSTQGAKFDLPNVPAAARVKKMYTGPAKVSKDSFPYGKFPSDISKIESVTEDRLWALELEPIKVEKGGMDESYTLPMATHDTTLVLRIDPQATPSGEVNPGASDRG